MLANYVIILSVRTFWALVSTFFYLAIGRYPSSVYFNIALMLPMFWDYQDLVGVRYKDSTKNSVKVCALMLWEDILLDEQGIDPQQLEQMFATHSNHLSPDQMALLKLLNDAQINEDFEGKGFWLPALAFPFNPKMNQQEITALAELGFWIKCVDDLVDYTEDATNQNSNFYLSNKSGIPAAELNERQRRAAFESVGRLNYSPEKISRFLYRISIATLAFKLHNEQLKLTPDWWQRLCNSYQPLLFINLCLACVRQFHKFNFLQGK